MSREKVYEMLSLVDRNKLLVCHTHLGSLVTIGRRGERYEIDGNLQDSEDIKSFLGELCTHCEIV
ncbi:MAG TPA: hypothetical protein ACFYD3_02450 [Candidatus Hypogeohydataceae bacterium YC41]